MSAAPTTPTVPAWPAAFFSLIHPAQIAAVEAFLWIEEPLSSLLVYEVLDASLALRQPSPTTSAGSPNGASSRKGTSSRGAAPPSTSTASPR